VATTGQLVDDDGAVAVQAQGTHAEAVGLVEGGDDGAGLGFGVAAADVEGARHLVAGASRGDEHDANAEGARARDRSAVDVNEPGRVHQPRVCHPADDGVAHEANRPVGHGISTST
jgi:hypothetical protein